MKVALYALGCKVNQYEADCYAKMFEDKGWEVVPFESESDVYVINTCAITNIGERKSRQILRRAKKKAPHAIVVATGCYAQTKAEELKKIEEVDVVLGTSKRTQIVELVTAKINGQDTDAVSDIMKERLYEELECAGKTERTRAYIKIQDGCDNFCSYCIVPYARGPVRSRKIENIVNEAKRLSEKGFCEVVLTGISVASYGKDLKEKPTLSDAIKAVCQTEGIKRVRLSSIDPRAFSDEFIEFLASQTKICRHFHISLQSGSSSVLFRMNRKYTADDYLKTLEKIREAMPDCGITTDIICGFPEESEEEFSETMEFVKKARFLKVHVFPYSERSSTVAALMKQIPMKIREERAAALGALCESIAEEVEKEFVGSEHEVLFEQCENGECEGLAKNYLRIYVRGEKSLCSKVKKVKITERKNTRLYAELLEESN